MVDSCDLSSAIVKKKKNQDEVSLGSLTVYKLVNDGEVVDSLPQNREH